MHGRWFCSATSCARRCFFTVSGKYVPPFTVASFATITQVRPSTIADSGDDARRRRLAVVDVPGSKRVQLEERRARVDEPVDPLARRAACRASGAARATARRRPRRRAPSARGARATSCLHPRRAARRSLVARDVAREDRHAGLQLTSSAPGRHLVADARRRPSGRRASYGAETTCSIFIASSTTSGWCDSTCSPAATRTSITLPGIGAVTRPSPPPAPPVRAAAVDLRAPGVAAQGAG